MSNVIRMALALAVSLGVGCGKDGGDPDDGLTDTDTDPNDTDTDTDVDPTQEAVDFDAVLSPSHDGIPVELERTNHVSVSVDSPAGPLHFFVDSGASTTVLTEQTAAALGLTSPNGVPVTPTGLSVGGFAIAPSLTVIVDLDATNAGLAASGEQPIDGILGAPFLAAHDAVLVYPESTLYLVSGASPGGLAGALGDAADAGGYDTVSLSPNLASFVELSATIDGSDALDGIVDTGAGASLVEKAAAARLGLSLEPAPTGAATIGGAVNTQQTTVSEWVIGDDHVVTDRTLLVVDLTGINSQLSAAGLHPIEVLVGGDLLIEQDGVLDYVGNRLFLRP